MIVSMMGSQLSVRDESGDFEYAISGVWFLRGLSWVCKDVEGGVHYHVALHQGMLLITAKSYDVRSFPGVPDLVVKLKEGVPAKLERKLKSAANKRVLRAPMPLCFS